MEKRARHGLGIAPLKITCVIPEHETREAKIVVRVQCKEGSFLILRVNPFI